MPSFTALREQLIDYRQADIQDRQTLLNATIQSIKDYPQVENKAQAISAYEAMAYAATLINYADALRRIEHQDFFDILIDFKMLDLFKEDKFTELNTYFEFHLSAPQMRLKTPIADIPTPIWKLFRAAQKEQLRSQGKSHLFNLDELNIEHPPENQLYPLPIQMLGKLNNEAVDRVSANIKGQYRFAKRFGVFLLPGGGMVEINLANSQHKLMHKMLDEHLEEERANLFMTARDQYNQLKRESFLTTLAHFITNKKFETILGNNELQFALEKTLDESALNADILSKIIQLIDDFQVDPSRDITAQKQFLHALRSNLQVETFKLHPWYNLAFEHIKANTTMVDIEQFGDTRACGGQQTSHCFLMTGEPLEMWFGHKLGDTTIEMGDDLTGSAIVQLTLLEALANFAHIKFSHILIVLTHNIKCLKNEILDYDHVWQPEQYEMACSALIKGGEKVLAALQPTPVLEFRLFKAAEAALPKPPNKEETPAP